jgi:ABC-type sugar transport system substrate-binding protein
MKKRLIAGLLILAMGILSACGSAATSETTTVAPTQAVTDAAAPATSDAGQSTPPASTASGAVNTAAFDEFPRPKMNDGSSKFRLAYVHNDLSFENQARAFNQVRLECAYRDWDLVDIVTSDEAGTRSAIINAINQDVDAILFYSVDAMLAKQDLVVQAREAGIGVYNADNTMVPGIISNVTLPAGIASMNLFYYTSALYQGKANFTVWTNYEFKTILERSTAFRAYLDESTVYPEMVLLDEQVSDFTNPIAPGEQAFNTVKAWLTRFGDELDVIFCISDNDALPMSEAIKQAGGSDTKIISIDGSGDAISYMRNPDDPILCTYGQSHEAFVHQAIEICNQIQIQGLNPGDTGCDIGFVKQVLYIPGTIVDRSNLPAPGSSIHSLFDYYDPNAGSDVWYNWSANSIEPYKVQ